MLLGRSLALAACMLSATAIASAQSGAKVADPASTDLNVNTGKASSANTATNASPSTATVDTGATSSKASLPAGSPAPASAVLVEGSSSQPTPAATPKEDRGGYKDEKGVRHDPSGKKGISPYFETLRRGDEAAMAGDFIKAEEAYSAAIGIDPRNPLAHLRRGQALVRAGKLTQAEAVYQEALRLSEKDPTQHASALFVLADLKERQGLRDEAIAAWKHYADYVRKEPSAKAYPETPVERDKCLKKYNEVAVASKAVRERIELRVKEVDEANKRKTAKNPNANR